jgi:hypothetical protein
MRKSHFNDEFLVFLGPIISKLFTCSNEEKNNKKQRVLALVLSLWDKHHRISAESKVYQKSIYYAREPWLKGKAENG